MSNMLSCSLLGYVPRSQDNVYGDLEGHKRLGLESCASSTGPNTGMRVLFLPEWQWSLLDKPEASAGRFMLFQS